MLGSYNRNAMAICFCFIFCADGLRTARTNGTDTWKYVYNGSQLVGMKKGNDTLYFTYDASGTPTTITHNGTVYYYVTNLQGDVVKIVSATGTTVATYTYDAWGNPLGTVPTSGIGYLNPLRYRGYVYDAETELYYLQSRYYNPELGRFINADSQLNTSYDILGCNMFVYCLNNPTTKADYGGNKPGDVFGTMDEAARDAAEYLGKLTWENTWEYATAIYTVTTTVKTYKLETKTHRFLWWSWTTTSKKAIKTKETKYTYTAVSTLQKVDLVAFPNAPRSKKRVAVLHTHPMGSWKGITRTSEDDRDWADDNNLPLYVHGPNGELKKYDPAIGKDIPIYDDLPKSPKTPWLE